jgi:thiamine biosynthesis lipoprotein
MKSLRFCTALLLAAALLLVACARQDVYREQRFVFGTLVEIQTWGVDENKARKAVAAVFADFERLHTALHPWRPGALTRLNGLLATGEWATVAPSNLPLIEDSIRLYRLSDGLFNPAIGKLVALWGFQSDTLPTKPPPQAAIDALLRANPTMADIELDGIRIRSRNPAVKLDFGGIAKGYAVDLGIARLQGLGIHNAIINAGGDISAIGSKGGKPWRIGIRHPRQSGVLASVELAAGESIFTSGDYERYFDYQGHRYHHIIDPRTGRPAEGATSVTVIHHNGAESDAAATALLVAGPADWHRIAQQLGIHYVLLVASDGTVYMNPAMAARVHFEVDPPPHVVISAPL